MLADSADDFGGREDVFLGIGEGDFQSVIMSPLISILNLGYTFRIAFRSSLRRALKWRGDSISGAKIRCRAPSGICAGFPSGIRGVR